MRAIPGEQGRARRVQPCAHPLSGLIEVHYRRSADGHRNPLDGGSQRLSGLGNARLHAPRRELDAKQVGQNFSRVRNRLQLLLRQIDQRALDHPVVLHGRGDVVRKAAAMALTTPEPRFISAVLGHWQRWLDQIEHLAPLLKHDLGVCLKVRTAALTVLRQRVLHITSGLATRLSVVPACPACPPGLRPLDGRHDLGFLANPSDDGGLLEW